MLGNPSC